MQDVEAQEQGEQDDPSDYETENQEGNNEELATVNGNDEEENPELSDVEDIDQPEQDDPSQYENQEGKIITKNFQKLERKEKGQTKMIQNCRM
ncbi:hypothetical protein LQK80_00645 [Bacillus thuringiensis]|nr:hypothetical protein [Bacillus thuringiensis]